MRKARLHPLLAYAGALGGALLMGSCSTARRMESLQRATSENLARVQEHVFPGRKKEAIDIDRYRSYPRGGQAAAGGPAAPAAPLKLDLRKSLRLAAEYSRAYQTSKETLYQSALALRETQHDWDWNPDNNLSTLLSVDQDPSSTAWGADGGVTLGRRFLSGARLTAGIGMQTLRYFSGDHSVSISSLASLTVSQPLLGGSGAEVNREPLTMAERSLVYALRSYVQARKKLLIEIAGKYYAILNAQDSLEIGKQNLASVTASMERSKAVAEAGRVDPFQVDQARQRVLNAENGMVALRENLQSAMDALKTTLGLPLEVAVEVDPEDLRILKQKNLPRPPLTFEAAVAQALERRLDYATARDRLEDARRRVRLAEDAMRARLDLKGKATAGSAAASRFERIEFEKADYSLGLEADLPFDRTDEAIALKEALIGYEQQKRRITEEHDGIVASLRQVWRQLRSYEQNYRIQQVSVRLAEKRVESTELLFEGGRINIRELLEAQDDLSSARNSLTQALVNHRLGWLRLLDQLESLPVDADTLWSDSLDV